MNYVLFISAGVVFLLFIITQAWHFYLLVNFINKHDLPDLIGFGNLDSYYKYGNTELFYSDFYKLKKLRRYSYLIWFVTLFLMVIIIIVSGILINS